MKEGAKVTVGHCVSEDSLVLVVVVPKTEWEILALGESPVVAEVAVSDIVRPGQYVGHVDQTIGGVYTGNRYAAPEGIYYTGLDEAEVAEVLEAAKSGDRLLILKPIRRVAEYFLAPNGGSLQFEVNGRFFWGPDEPELVLEPGMVIGTILGPLLDPEGSKVIWEGPRSRVLYVLPGDCGFFNKGEPWLIVEQIENDTTKIT